jgi:acyl-homoserine lactone acylase PvdQ
VAVGGASECVNSCDVSTSPTGADFSATSGPVQRMIVDMADNDRCYQSIGTGQSGQWFSPHRADQLQSWAAVDLVPIAFSMEQRVKQALHHLTLDTEYHR